MEGASMSAAEILLGLVLTFYPIGLASSLRPVAERVTSAAAGLPLALLAALMPFGGAAQTTVAVVLSVIGALLSSCHQVFTAFVVSLVVSVALAGAAWQLTLCPALSGEAGGLWHAMLLLSCAVVGTGLLTCTPNVAGQTSLMYFSVPLLSGLLVALGALPFLSAAGGQSLSMESIVQSSPCAADDDAGVAGIVHGLAVWFTFSALASGFQFVWARRVAAAAAKNGGLGASLLPGAAGDGEGPGIKVPQPNEDQGRHAVLTKAIFADPSADLSHLTDNERKLVAICREDEFERDRLLWGGGLI